MIHENPIRSACHQAEEQPTLWNIFGEQDHVNDEEDQINWNDVIDRMNSHPEEVDWIDPSNGRTFLHHVLIRSSGACLSLSLQLKVIEELVSKYPHQTKMSDAAFTGDMLQMMLCRYTQVPEAGWHYVPDDAVGTLPLHYAVNPFGSRCPHDVEVVRCILEAYPAAATQKSYTVGEPLFWALDWDENIENQQRRRNRVNIQQRYLESDRLLSDRNLQVIDLLLRVDPSVALRTPPFFGSYDALDLVCKLWKRQYIVRDQYKLRKLCRLTELIIEARHRPRHSLPKFPHQIICTRLEAMLSEPSRPLEKSQKLRDIWFKSYLCKLRQSLQKEELPSLFLLLMTAIENGYRWNPVVMEILMIDPTVATIPYGAWRDYPFMTAATTSSMIEDKSCLLDNVREPLDTVYNLLRCSPWIMQEFLQ